MMQALRGRARPGIRIDPGMMKKLPVLCAACRGPLPSPPSPRPTPGRGREGALRGRSDAGVTFPFGAGYDPGWTVNGSFDYYLSRLFAIRGTASYASYSTDFTDVVHEGVLPRLGRLRSSSAAALRPYARAGLGVYAVSPPVGRDSRARVGVHAGRRPRVVPPSAHVADGRRRLPPAPGRGGPEHVLGFDVTLGVPPLLLAAASGRALLAREDDGPADGAAAGAAAGRLARVRAR